MRMSSVVVTSAVLASLSGCSKSDDSGGSSVTESQVDAWIANDGYVHASDLAPVATDGTFASLTGVPAGLADGDDTLTEAQVDAFVANDGYATLTQVDAGLAALAEVARDGSFASLVDVPAGLADGDDVATYTVGDGLTLSGSTISVASDVVRRDASGDVVVSGAYRYATPRTGHAWVPASAFQRRYQGPDVPYGLEFGSAYLHLIGSSAAYPPPYSLDFTAPAALPHGATVTGFTCFVYDSHPSGDVLSMSVALERTVFPFTVQGVAGISAVATTGTPGTVSFSAPTIVNAVVDTESATYGVFLQWRVDTVSSVVQMLGFLGCRVAYEHDSVL